MASKIAGLMAGPLLLIALGFILAGEWGAIIGLFIGLAALVFVPAFGALIAATGARSLLTLIALANVVPAGWWAYSCPLSGNACPNYTFAAAAPWYVAATFCAVVYWAFKRRSDAA